MSETTTTQGAPGAPGDANGHGGAGPLPLASFDDPHLQPLAKHPKRAEATVATLLVIGLLGFAAYGAVYWVGGQPQVEGITMGIGLFFFGFGLSAWGKYLLPQGPFVEQRHELCSPSAARQAMAAAVTERGGMVFRRRSVLGGILGAGGAVMGVVLAFPLLRSLGPVPKESLDTTNWKKGSHLVDSMGRRVHVTDLEVGGALTVFPEGYTSDEDMAVDQTMLIRVAGPDVDIVTDPHRKTWGPDGYLAFSKVCTHAGCPVGLFQHQTLQLVCPCHQSMFDVGQGSPALPVFGPAPRPLPQLPLYVDSAGFLRSQDSYDQPIGPGFWERTTRAHYS